MRGREFLQNPDAYPDMDYLLSEAAQFRCVIAAQVLKDCPQVLEIGGFTTPISQYLRGTHQSVTVVDPLMCAYSSDALNGQPCEVRHIPESFQQADLGRLTDYGFVMLGISLKHFSEDTEKNAQEWQQLSDLVVGARVAVIEAAVDWPLGKSALDRLIQLSGMKVRSQLDLDLSGNEGMDPEHFRRRMIVLVPA